MGFLQVCKQNIDRYKNGNHTKNNFLNQIEKILNIIEHSFILLPIIPFKQNFCNKKISVHSLKKLDEK